MHLQVQIGRRLGLTALALSMLLACGCVAPPSSSSGSRTVALTTTGSTTAGRSAATSSLAALTTSATIAPTTVATRAQYRAMDVQQQGTCDGMPVPKSLSLLPTSAHLTAAVMCVDTQKYVAGHGVWTYAQVLPLPPAKLPELFTGLTQPDVQKPDNGPCTANLVSIPAFVVTLSDGSRIRPGVPGDGCHPRQDALQAFGDPASIKPRSETRTTQVLGDLETTSNCGDGAKSPAIWISMGQRGKGRATLPAAGSVSICFYHGVADQQGELTRVGVVPVEHLRPLWQKLPAGKVSACAPPADAMTVPPVDWLMFLPTPNPPYQYGTSVAGPIAPPIALLELGGCRRLLSVTDGLAGEVSSTLGKELAELANHRVH